MAARAETETSRSGSASGQMASRYAAKPVSTSTPRVRAASARSSPSASLLHSPLPYSPSCFIPDTRTPKKPDLMMKHKQMRKQWERYSLLTNDAREGRKFNLADHLQSYQPTFRAQRKGVKFSYNTFVPPNEKRRDHLRFQVRMQLMNGRTAIAGKR